MRKSLFSLFLIVIFCFTSCGQAQTGDDNQQIIENTEFETESIDLHEYDFTVCFAGDISLDESAVTTAQLDASANGIYDCISPELLERMQQADVMCLNNEFTFSTNGSPLPNKMYTFRANPTRVSVLQEMGVDIVSLANNHSLDFGTEALKDTFATLDDAGILYAGAGDSKGRAEALQIIEVNGLKFGFLAATRVIPVSQWNVEFRRPGLITTYDDTRLVECIEAAREECDFLTVYVHWGIEREAYPQDYQTAIAKNCFNAGADLVIGAHPHVLQGIEFMNGKPVFYSLGNYIFAQTIARTALVKVEVQSDGEATYSLIPAYAEDGRTIEFEGTAAVELFDYMNEISPRAFIDEKGYIYDIDE